MAHRENGRLLLEAESISRIKWLRGEQIAVRGLIKAESGNKQEVLILDANSGHREVLERPSDMEDYSISDDGETIVFSRRFPQEQVSNENASTTREGKLRGFRVVYGSGMNDLGERRSETFEIWLAKRDPSGKLSVSRLSFSGPDGAPQRFFLRNVMSLSL